MLVWELLQPGPVNPFYPPLFFACSNRLDMSLFHSNGTASSSTSSIVKLNIGGYKYQTSKQTLCSAPFRASPDEELPNYFCGLLDGNLTPSYDAEGFIFIDRDGQYFAPILEFLRTGQVNIPSSMPRHAVFREAQFYAINLPDQISDLDGTMLFEQI